jgi:hypothetical protein
VVQRLRAFWFCTSLAVHRHPILVIPSSSSYPTWPSHFFCPIVIAVSVTTGVVVLVVGVDVVAVAVVIDIVASSLSCLPCYLMLNPRNSTKASQSGIAHVMGKERLSSDWLDSCQSQRQRH